jgi:hypothetical protein
VAVESNHSLRSEERERGMNRKVRMSTFMIENLNSGMNNWGKLRILKTIKNRSVFMIFDKTVFSIKIGLFAAG